MTKLEWKVSKYKLTLSIAAYIIDMGSSVKEIFQ
jgi:hypothetical protein